MKIVSSYAIEIKHIDKLFRQVRQTTESPEI